MRRQFHFTMKMKSIEANTECRRSTSIISKLENYFWNVDNSQWRITVAFVTHRLLAVWVCVCHSMRNYVYLFDLSM